MELRGKYTNAKVFTDIIEQEAISQIINILNNPISKNANPRFMPDVHAGAGAVIGTTMHLTDIIIPNLIGVDIGCGVIAQKINEKNINFENFDKNIKEHIPSGKDRNNSFSLKEIEEVFNSLNVEISFHDFLNEVKDISTKINENYDDVLLSLCSLGGGNHFIEVDKDEDNNYYILIHSGSRHFGLKVANFHQTKAKKNLKKQKILKIIEKYKKEGKEYLIQGAIEKINSEKIQNGLEYLEGKDAKEYFHDMNIAQIYARLNRAMMLNRILKFNNLTISEPFFESIHNYINFEDKIIRKGAISSHKGERLLIPLNMRDGIIIGIGKGNSDWNFSAPHGAGRIMSRSKAKRELSVDDFKNTMKGIYSTVVGFETLDESPMAYKPSSSIIEAINDTVEIEKIIKPVYNFKGI